MGREAFPGSSPRWTAEPRPAELPWWELWLSCAAAAASPGERCLSAAPLQRNSMKQQAGGLRFSHTIFFDNFV